MFTVYHEDIPVMYQLYTQAVEMITLTCHYKAIPADSTIVRLYKLFTKLSNWEVMLDSHCSVCNADGAVYQTHQELILLMNLLLCNLKSMCLEKIEYHANYIFLWMMSPAVLYMCTMAVLQSAQHC